MTKTGRNEPCPCGSGKKYKHCCQNSASLVNEDLSAVLAGQNFASLEDVQATVDQFTQQRNRQASDDFHGMSPEQMHHALHFAFDSPELFHFSQSLSAQSAAPVLRLAEYIVRAIDEKGLKLTAKGNLPQKLCKEAFNSYKEQHSDDPFLLYGKINKEEDFFDLHVTRLLLELAGFSRKAKGRLYLTKKCRQLLEGDEKGVAGLYPELLKSYCQKFNWAYRDGFDDDLAFIQQAAVFSLYLLKLHGSDWRPFSFYEDCFIQAFPMLLDQIKPRSWCTVEDQLRRCYSLRTLDNFLCYFGLVKVESLSEEREFPKNKKIRALPLLDEVVQFLFLP